MKDVGRYVIQRQLPFMLQSESVITRCAFTLIWPTPHPPCKGTRYNALECPEAVVFGKRTIDCSAIWALSNNTTWKPVKQGIAHNGILETAYIAYTKRRALCSAFYDKNKIKRNRLNSGTDPSSPRWQAGICELVTGAGSCMYRCGPRRAAHETAALFTKSPLKAQGVVSSMVS